MVKTNGEIFYHEEIGWLLLFGFVAAEAGLVGIPDPKHEAHGEEKIRRISFVLQRLKIFTADPLNSDPEHQYLKKTSW